MTKRQMGRIAALLCGLLLLGLCTGCGAGPQRIVSESGSQSEGGSQLKDGSQSKGAGGQTDMEPGAGKADPGTAGVGDSAASGGALSGEELADQAGGQDLAEALETQTADPADGQAERFLEVLSLEEKAAQLFIVLPEVLESGTEGLVTELSETARQTFGEMPVGGFVYMRDNLISAEQTRALLADTQAMSMERLGIPVFLTVDEEGGSVARIGGSGRFDVPVIEDMARVGAAGDAERAREVGRIIGGYLAELGFSVDFAPDADVLSNPENTVVKKRSFGSDPELAADMALAVSEGLKEQGIFSVWKHFPGHGATAGDTHEGYAYTDKTLEELTACELIPFQRAVDTGAKFIMAGHISLPNIVPDGTPASLSPVMITQVLREQMGYEGIVITDAMNMGAVVQQYGSGEAAIRALEAGVDLILMPEDFEEAYESVLQAVASGRLTEERLDQSLRRILKVKLEWMETMGEQDRPEMG